MSTFAKTSIRAAESFLQTVVVVDNRAQFGPEDASEAVAEKVDAPDEFVTGDTDGPVDALPASTNITDGPLDAQKLSRSFACKKLACAILRPSLEDPMKEAVLNAAQRSDILVLDWQMYDSGDRASSIIADILDTDGQNGRLRLIAIYTSQSPLAGVATSLVGKVAALKQEGTLPVLTSGSARVILLSKGKTANAPDEDIYAVDEEALSERLIEEFAKFAQGLLSNATMAAIAGLRDHTHRMLARFDASMDGPLLTHRTLLKSATDAEEFAADMIMAELEAQVPVQRIVSEYLGDRQIKQYVTHRIKNGLKPAVAVNRGETPNLYQLNAKKTCALIEQGFSAIDGDIAEMNKIAKVDPLAKFRKTMKEELHVRLYQLLYDDRQQSLLDHSQFAVRSKIRRDASTIGKRYRPHLRLGSILASGDRYWVCLTPTCDSTRIPAAGGSFLFAELTETNSNFDLIVPDNGTFRRVELERKRTRLMSLNFKPDKHQNVVAKRLKGSPCFEPLTANGQADAKRALRWIADLKPMHAQRLVQSYASNLTRVGVDDFEWHRIQMPGGIAE